MSSKRNNKKFIFVTGGVASSLGKGLATASIAALLERRGIKINMLKMDPYINVDPGTMSPIQHGEVFVTDDGAETDLDLGHYERFTSLSLDSSSNFTTGQVYLQVIENEREGRYLGKTVQVVPHITDEIKRRIHIAAEDGELLLSEIGGTVGDIESLPFLEAIRQFGREVGEKNVVFIHLVLIPYLSQAGELKSKPAQHSVKELRSIGLQPNFIICRSDQTLESSVIDKISLFCNVPVERVFSSIDLDSIYRLPLNFHYQGLDEKITDFLGMWATAPKIEDLKNVVYNIEHPLRPVKIGIVGKYTGLIESYKSLNEALNHGAIANQLQLESVYIDAEELEDPVKQKEILSKIQGILVPGGFGERGVEGKISAIRYARENRIPYFGICLGMQLAMVEIARHVAGIADASSEEFGPQGSPVVHYMEGQDGGEIKKGGTMRLGAYDCHLEKGTLVQNIYQKIDINERHRHRLEINDAFLAPLREVGVVVSGINRKFGLVEVIELSDHPFFIGCQYHPEFKSKPHQPHPLFKRFLEEADKVKRE